MRLSQYALNARVGSFLGVNNGTVDNCVADVHSLKKTGGASFVFENNAKITNSISLRGTTGKEEKTFYAMNTGTVLTSGNITSPIARKLRGNASEIRQQLGLEVTVNNGFLTGLFGGKNGGAASGGATPIRTAQDLLAVIQAVNAGDRGAANAHYVLVNSINMRGAKLAPIGVSDDHPFTGIFDGNGKTVSNFTIDCRGAVFGGFFGCTKNARVSDLTLDFILKGRGGGTVGGMAGLISGGSFTNCRVVLAMSPGMCSGGFCGKNSGLIRNCSVGGKIAPPVAVQAWLIPCATVVLAALTVGTVMLIQKINSDVKYNPEIIDPNQVPVPKPSEKEDPPPAGTNRISLELNHEVYISAATMVGQMDYINPWRSTQDVVIRLCISDAELTKAGYDLIACKVRTESELNDPNYDPAKSYTVLYRSQRLQIGHKLSYCKLTELPNGEKLKLGDYEMVMMIDAYDPNTNEKSIVNAQATTTIHVVDR